jgi:hypothetical protein
MNIELTLWGRVLDQKPVDVHIVKTFFTLMELEVSLPCSQESVMSQKYPASTSTSYVLMSTLIQGEHT